MSKVLPLNRTVGHPAALRYSCLDDLFGNHIIPASMSFSGISSSRQYLRRFAKPHLEPR